MYCANQIYCEQKIFIFSRFCFKKTRKILYWVLVTRKRREEAAIFSKKKEIPSSYPLFV
jgi:hypothetical protein